jgi:hypothetical protein
MGHGFNADPVGKIDHDQVDLQAFRNELGSSLLASRLIAGSDKGDGATTKRLSRGAAD